MSLFVLIVTALLATVSADTSKWLDFRVRFSFNPNDAGVSAFFPIELTQSEALQKGWVRVSVEDSLGATTLCLSENDLRVCPIYDGNGYIAGLLLAVLPEDVENSPIYDITRHDVYEKKNINGKPHWTSTYYIVNPQTITAGGRPSASRTGDGLWIKHGRSFMEVPTDIESIKTKTDFKWQNCVPNMGAHFYYNMTKALDCADFYPFFLLGKDGNMIGVGWQVPGKTEYAERNWYEDITGAAVQFAAPFSPDCLHQNVDRYGVISIHMYFVETPWAIPCDHEVDSTVPPQF